MILLPLLSKIIKQTLLVTSINLRFVMVCCIMTDCYTYRKAMHDFNFSELDMTHWLLAILDSIRPWNYCLVAIGGFNFGSSWRHLWAVVMFVLVQKILVITFMDFFSHFLYGLQFPWISSWIFRNPTHLIPF